MIDIRARNLAPIYGVSVTQVWYRFRSVPDYGID